jgi:hypothetical protein
MKVALSEDQLFEIKQKFLRTIPHPKLILKQILRLDKGFSFKAGPKVSASNLIDYIEGYEIELLAIKLKISNAKDDTALLTVLVDLLSSQYSLIQKLASYCPKLENELEYKIKMSDPFETYAIFKFLKEEELKESEIKNYLYKELENDRAKEPSVLAVSVLRAKKITANE